MALESVLFGPGSLHSTPQSTELFYLAQAISGLTNLAIIDSYSSASSPQRYKGDPIADGKWTGVSSVGPANSWIVVEAINSTVPAWQVKFQSCNSGQAFHDPSGINYGWDGDTNYAMYVRFSPYGGWSLADVNPNFDSGVNPSTQVGANRQTKMWTTAGIPCKHFLTCDEGTLVMFNRQENGDRPFYFYTYFGDYTPKSLTQSGAEARCSISVNAYNAANYYVHIDFGVNESIINEAEPHVTTYMPQIGFLGAAGSFVQTYFSTLPFQNFMSSYSQPNQFDTSLKLDLAPIIMRGIAGVWDGVIGELRLMRKAYSPGRNIKFGTTGNNQWLALHWGYSAVVAWDGNVSSIY